MAGLRRPGIYSWCEANRVAYAIGLPSNAVLTRESEPWRERARRGAASSPTGTARCFGSFWYQAGGWEKPRKVIVKAEVTAQGPNPRYVVVSGLPGTPRENYRFYGRRGTCENRIKELKDGIKSDRTSCCEFASNKVRLMFAAVAYVLFQQLRRTARRTGLAHAQVETLRGSLVKIAAQVKDSRRRVHVALASSCPAQPLFRLLARRLCVVDT